MKFLFLFLFFIFAPQKIFATTMSQDLMSPLSTTAAYSFWSGAAITTFLLFTEDHISDVITEDTATRRPLGDASKIGDYYGQVYPNLIYFAGMGIHGFFSNSRRSYGRAAHMFKATFYSGLVTTVLKYTVREPRPNSLHEKNSFPSGHTTTAFAFASVVAVHHDWYWGVLALTGAALTGYSRMNDGRHFLHDVSAGMTIGVSYGLGTYFTQYRGQGRRFAIVPIIDHQTTGMRFVASW